MLTHFADGYDLVHHSMASIDKNPGAKFPFRYCAYRLPNGKRGFRSTKQTDHAKALQFCRMLE
jgi:hypothetical protein